MQANFDTLEYIEELIKVGIEPLHAEAITKATAKAISQATETENLEIKQYIYETKIELIEKINASTWKIVSLVGGAQSLLLGAFGLIQYLTN